MSKSHSQYLTDGNVPNQLIRFALPFLFSNILQSLYGLVDSLIVSIYVGHHAVGGVNIGTRYMNLLLAVATGLTTAGSVLVAQYHGSRQPKKVNKTIGTLFSAFFIFGIFMTFVTFFLSEPLVNFVRTPIENHQHAVDYLRMTSLGIIFTIGYNSVASVLRGVGDSKSTMLFVMIAAIVNTVLDILFVGYFHMGTLGAGLATTMSQAMSFLAAIIYMRRNHQLFDFKRKSFKIEIPYLKQIIQVGLPSAAQMVLMNVSGLMLSGMVNGYGGDATSAMGIGMQVDQFAMMPSFAFSNATSAMVGQNVGAKKYDRVKSIVKTSIFISACIAVVLMISNMYFAEKIVRIFVKEADTTSGVNTIMHAANYVKINAISLPILAAMFTFNGLSTGSGNTLFTLINSAVNTILLRVPIAYLLSTYTSLGLNGVFWGLSLAPLGSLLAGFIFYKSEKWKTSNLTLIDDEETDEIVKET